MNNKNIRSLSDLRPGETAAVLFSPIPPMTSQNASPISV